MSTLPHFDRQDRVLDYVGAAELLHVSTKTVLKLSQLAAEQVEGMRVRPWVRQRLMTIRDELLGE